MPTDKQKLGDWGEAIVAKTCSCPSCKRLQTTKLLPPNFKCADLICEFCGYLAQVKTSRVKDVSILPDRILGGAWGPQSERMQSGIYFPLYVVLTDKLLSKHSIYFLSADLQIANMFEPRDPLSGSARRAGWQGFIIRVNLVKERFVKLV